MIGIQYLLNQEIVPEKRDQDCLIKDLRNTLDLHKYLPYLRESIKVVIKEVHDHQRKR